MPRKTLSRPGEYFPIEGASMRPRPDAAENLEWDGRPLPERIASMRPRPDAAENEEEEDMTRHWWQGFNEAAARCRGKHTSSRPSPTSCAWLQ